MNKMVFIILALTTISISIDANANFKVGPTGGVGGYSFEKTLTQNERICGLNVYHDNRINAIQLRICDEYNNVYFSEIFGGSKGTLSSVAFQQNEIIEQFTIRTVIVGGSPRIAELSIWTSTNKSNSSYAWGGHVRSGYYQQFDLINGYEFSGIFGRRATELDSLGFIYRKRTSFNLDK